MNIKNIDSSKTTGNINSISAQPTRKELKSKDSATQKANVITDKLQISEQAKNMQNIKNRIETGYYNKNEIIRNTAEKIYQKISKS
jgi:hypothetical protein